MDKARKSMRQYWERNAAYHDFVEQKYRKASTVDGLPEKDRERLEMFAEEAAIKASEARFRLRLEDVKAEISEEYARRQDEWGREDRGPVDAPIVAQWAGPTEEQRAEDAIQRGTVALFLIGALVLIVVGMALTVQKVMP